MQLQLTSIEFSDWYLEGDEDTCGGPFYVMRARLCYKHWRPGYAKHHAPIVLERFVSPDHWGSTNRLTRAASELTETALRYAWEVCPYVGDRVQSGLRALCEVQP